MSSPLAGAWNGGPEGYQGQFVFTDTHYNGLFIRDDRQTIEEQSLNNDQEAAAYRALLAGAGAYSIQGSMVTLNAEYDRIPRPPTPSTWEMTFIGDELQLKHTTSGSVWTLRKVG